MRGFRLFADNFATTQIRVAGCDHQLIEMVRGVDPMTAVSKTVAQVAAEIRRTIRLFREPGSLLESRTLGIPGRGRPHQAAGYYTDHDLAAEHAAEIDVRRKPAGCYLVMNEIDSALLARSPNQMTDYPDSTTADANVTRRTKLLIDLDPDRPKGIPSSDEELEASRIVGGQVRHWMMGDLGFYEPIEAMSGNGTHLLFPIDLPNDEESTRIVKDILEAAAARFGGRNTPAGLPSVKVDTSVFNASRITKLYGTVARKGHGIPGRPIRRSKLVYVPHYLEPAEDGGHKNES